METSPTQGDGLTSAHPASSSSDLLVPLVLTEGAVPPEPRRRSSNCVVVASILPVAFLSCLTYGLLVPVLPGVKADWFTNCTAQTGGNESIPCKPDYHAAARYGSVFDSLKGLACFLLAAQLGRISDSCGRRPILFVQVLLATLPAAVLVVWPSTPGPYFAASIVAGCAGSSVGGITLIQSCLADIFEPEERVKYFGIVLCSEFFLTSNDGER